MQNNFFIVKTALVLYLGASGCAIASEITINNALLKPSEASVSVRQDAPVVMVAPVVVSGFGTPILNNQLADSRGGFDQVNNDMQLSGTVTHNTAVNVATGSNYVGEGSFTNASGFPMVIQNSGSNVLIQNATIINLQYQ